MKIDFLTRPEQEQICHFLELVRASDGYAQNYALLKYSKEAGTDDITQASAAWNNAFAEAIKAVKQLRKSPFSEVRNLVGRALDQLIINYTHDARLNGLREMHYSLSAASQGPLGSIEGSRSSFVIDRLKAVGLMNNEESLTDLGELFLERLDEVKELDRKLMQKTSGPQVETRELAIA